MPLLAYEDRGQLAKPSQSLEGVYLPFFFIPFTALTALAAGAWISTASDMLVVLRY
jgi:hypothetical protein